MFKIFSRRLARSHNQKGFTLVELMVVVVILGILAALVVPVLSEQIHRARDGRTLADMKTIHNALQLYFADENRYPVHTTGTTPNTIITPNRLSDYGLDVIPKDAWGNDFSYTATDVSQRGRNSTFTLISGGRDESFTTTIDNIFSTNRILPKLGQLP